MVVSAIAETKTIKQAALLPLFNRKTRGLNSVYYIHDVIIRRGYVQSSETANALLLNFYYKHRAFKDVIGLFKSIKSKETSQWNLVIGSFTRQGQFQQALLHFEEMKTQGITADKITYVHVLSACPSLGMGMILYENIRLQGLDSDTLVGTALVSMFAKHDSPDKAHTVFDNISVRNVVSWNAMVSVSAKANREFCVQYFFSQMQQEGISPDKITFLNVFGACANQVTCLNTCRKLHLSAMLSGFLVDSAVSTALAFLYGKCGHLKEARLVFDEMEQRSTVSWNAMLTLCAQNGRTDYAFYIFSQMQLEDVILDDVSFIGLLDSCRSKSRLAEIKKIHVRIHSNKLDCHVIVVTSLINAYVKCGNLQSGHRLFAELNNRNIISWNSIIAGHTQYSKSSEVLELLCRMQVEGVIPNKHTFMSVASALASKASLQKGKMLHSVLVHDGLDMNDFIASSLISMYGKCGSIVDGQKHYNKLKKPMINSWNALIGVYAQNGNAVKVLQLFSAMLQQGVKADEITFTSVLSACNHCGLIGEGCHYFVGMHLEHGVLPTEEHYDCMIDLLCRTGLQECALCLATEMPCKPTIISLTSLFFTSQKCVNE